MPSKKDSSDTKSESKPETPAPKKPVAPLHPVFDLDAFARADNRGFAKRLAHELTVRGFDTPAALSRPNADGELMAALQAAYRFDVVRLKQSVKQEGNHGQ